MKSISVKTKPVKKIPKKFLEKVPELDRLLLRFAHSNKQGSVKENAITLRFAYELMEYLMEREFYEAALSIAIKLELEQAIAKTGKKYLQERLERAIEHSQKDLKEINLIKQECQRYCISFEELVYETLKKVAKYRDNFNLWDTGKILGLNRVQVFRIAKELYEEVKDSKDFVRYSLALKLGLIKQRQLAAIEWAASILADQGLKRMEEWKTRNNMRFNDGEIQKIKERAVGVKLLRDVYVAWDFAHELGLNREKVNIIAVETIKRILKTKPEAAYEILDQWKIAPEPGDLRTIIEWGKALSEDEKQDLVLTWLSKGEYNYGLNLSRLFEWTEYAELFEYVDHTITQTKREIDFQW